MGLGGEAKKEFGKQTVNRLRQEGTWILSYRRCDAINREISTI